MTTSWDDREHAFEALFAHDEEIRFLTHRRAIEALGNWASESMGLGGDAAAQYGSRLVDAYVSGMPEDRIAMMVQSDLERAGKPALSTTTATVLAQAAAQAAGELHGRAAPHLERSLRNDRHDYHPLNAALSWRD